MRISRKFLSPAFILVLTLGGTASELALDAPPTLPDGAGLESAAWSLITPFPATHANGLEPVHPASRATVGGAVTVEWTHPATLSLQVAAQQYLTIDVGAPVGRHSASPEDGAQRTWHEVAGATRLHAECGTGCFVHVTPLGESPIRAPFAGAAETPLETFPRVVIPNPTFYEWKHAAPVARAFLPAGALDTEVEIRGPHRIALWAVEGTLDTSQGASTLSAGDISDAPADAPVREVERRLIVIESDAPARITSLPDTGALLTTEDPVYAANGRVVAERATGTLQINGARRTLTRDALDLEGNLRLAPACNADANPRRDAKCAFRVDGETKSVRVNGVEVGHATLVTRTLAAGVLAALAFVAHRFFPVAGSAIVALYHRTTPDGALQHPRRKRVYELIAQRPGIHFRELQRAAAISYGDLRHHVQVLERVQLVRSQEQGGFRVFWPSHQEYTPQLATREIALSRDRAREIAARLAQTPGQSQRELARTAEMARPLVSYHVRRLVQAGLVLERADREGGRAVKRYFPTDDLAQALNRDVLDAA